MRFFRINISILKAHFFYSSKLPLGGVLQRAVLKNFKEITRKCFCRSLLLINFAVYNPFKNKCFPLGHKYFPMTFSKSFRTPFINNMLLYITQMFCMEICKILQSIFFIEHLYQLFLLFVETMILYITPRNVSSETFRELKQQFNFCERIFISTSRSVQLLSQLTLTCSKSTIEAQEKSLKYVQS